MVIHQITETLSRLLTVRGAPLKDRLLSELRTTEHAFHLNYRWMPQANNRLKNDGIHPAF